MAWSGITQEAIENGLLALYDLQTPVEQASNRTIERNGKGFDAIDAPILSWYVGQLRKRGHLHKPALDYVSKKLWKYREQLLNMGIVSEEMISPPEQLALEL